MKAHRLKSELRKANASELELAKLTALADKLGTVTPPGLSPAAKQRIANRLPVNVELEPKRPFYLRPLNVTIAGSVGALAAVTLVVSTLAQSAVPGSPLYDVKRSTDEIRSLLQPKASDELPEVHKEEKESLQKKPDAKPDTPKQIEAHDKKSHQDQPRATPRSSILAPQQSNIDAIRRQAEATRKWSELYKQQWQYQTDISQQYMYRR